MLLDRISNYISVLQVVLVTEIISRGLRLK